MESSDGKLTRSAAADRNLLIELATEGLTSSHTRRAYTAAIEEFLIWADGVEGSSGFGKSLVQNYRAMLGQKGLAPSSINQRLAAIRRMVREAADNGYLDRTTAWAVANVPGVRRHGTRVGRWLTAAELSEFLPSPCATLRSKRDRALLCLLAGAGLRRSEVSDVCLEQFKLIDERWVIVDITGKHGHVRSVPIPKWVKSAVDEWTSAASIASGRIMRRLLKDDRVVGTRLSPQAAYYVVRRYASAIDVDIRPHDLRRTFARLCFEGGADIDQLALSLGHASVRTTEAYVCARQNFRCAPCDALKVVGVEPRDNRS